MADISTINTVAIANVASIDSVLIANIASVNGILVPTGWWWATYWYVCCWTLAAYTNTTVLVTYSTWVATNGNNASSVHWENPATVSDTTTYWYICWWITWSTRIATTCRITFSTQWIAANTASNLSQARYRPMGMSDGSTYWYVCWWRTWWSGCVVTADRIVFSTSITSANTASNLPSWVGNAASISDWGTYWYFCWGTTAGANMIATSTRMTFSTGAVAANTISNLPANRWYVTWCSDWSTYWYIAWWRSTSPDASAQTIWYVLTFSTWATSSNTATNLSLARSNHSSHSDWATYWYWSGWYNTSAKLVATTDRITFSTAITAAYTTGNLPAARGMANALSDWSV